MWITGASAGLGKAMALAFARKGAKLILSARRQALLEEVAEQCRQAGSPSAQVYPLDMSDPEAIDSVARRVLAEQGPIDILVNNAGISQRSRILDTEMAVYRKIMALDYLAPVQLTKALLPSMLERGAGQVVVISSLVGKFATPLRSGYAAAKHALHGFFDALRAEHADDGLSVTLICPGFIQTEISLNALTGDGRPQQLMDQAQAQGMSPAIFAAKALRAIAQKKMEVAIGGKEKWSLYLIRFFPSAFKHYLRKARVT